MNTYLIDFKNDTTDEKIQEYINDNQLSQVKLFDRLDKTYQVSSENQPPITDIVNVIINDDESHLELLTTIEVPIPTIPNIKSVSSSDDNNWWKVYSIANADLDQPIIETKILGEGINIYVVDSGIDIDHTEFVNQDISLLFSFTNDFTDNNGHGTALSSLMVGNTCGLTNASLKIVKIFDNNVPTKQSDLLSALNAILEDASISSNKESIVNLSWSIPKNSFIESKIQCLINAGLYVVVAAGNSGMAIPDVTPASMSDVLTIGSYGKDFIPSDFSNFTSPLACTPNTTNFGVLNSWAPGENIYVATPNNNGYYLASGTSLACAIHSGSIAYLLSQYLKGNGELPLRYKQKENTVFILTMLERKGLLDLSDPKYGSSVNKICSYLDTNTAYKEDDLTITQRPIMVLAVQEEFSSTRFYKPGVIKSYEILGELPNGATIDGEFLNFNIQNDIVLTDHIREFHIPVRFDLVKDDISIDTYIQLVVIDSLFDPSTLTDDNPIMINLLAGGGCTASCPATRCGCPSPKVLLLMGDMTSKPAGDIQVGDFVYTIHEKNNEFGKFKVVAVEIENQPMVDIAFTDGTTISVSESHKFLMESGIWQQVYQLGEGSVIKGFEINKTIQSIIKLGLASAVKITVENAHTYIAEGLISHNLKATSNYGFCGKISAKSPCYCGTAP